MAIKISKSDVVPELVYDNFFLEGLHLTQKLSKVDTETPYYVLNVTYRLYAVDDKHQRHYENKVSVIEIKDYAAVAYAKAMAGDTDLINASISIEHALAKIIIDQKPELGEATVI